MKIILLQDIKNLGKKWEVKKVSDGYARNFLIPRGFVKLANEESLNELEQVLRQQEAEAERELKTIEETAASLDGYELVISEKASEDGKLYASVGADKISKALKKDGYEVPKRYIALEEPIKQAGEYNITLEFEHGLEAEIKIIVEVE